MQVLVYRPSDSRDSVDRNKPFLELSSFEPSSSSRVLVESISPDVYGQVPQGLTQVKPKNGEVPQLQEGKFYFVLFYVAGASTVGHYFVSKNGKAELAR
jgi:hypothetical protein